jgi:hypothetical protein
MVTSKTWVDRATLAGRQGARAAVGRRAADLRVNVEKLTSGALIVALGDKMVNIRSSVDR